MFSFSRCRSRRKAPKPCLSFELLLQVVDSVFTFLIQSYLGMVSTTLRKSGLGAF